MAITVNSKKKQVKKTFQELINDLMTSSSEKVRYNAARVFLRKALFIGAFPALRKRTLGSPAPAG